MPSLADIPIGERISYYWQARPKTQAVGAGLAAALPGSVASLTDLPVIGVPLDVGPLHGVDALYAIAQLPSGCPVGTVGIGNAKNAAHLAMRILKA